MNSYITSLITVSIIGGIVSNLVSSFTSVRKYVNYFVCLVAVICMISPLISFVKNLSSTKESIKSFFNSFVSEEIIEFSNDIIINTGIESVQNGLKNTLIDKFGFDPSEVIVNLTIDDSSIDAIKIKTINVILTGKSSWSDVDKVKEYLENTVGGTISVSRK